MISGGFATGTYLEYECDPETLVIANSKNRMFLDTKVDVNRDALNKQKGRTDSVGSLTGRNIVL